MAILMRIIQQFEPGREKEFMALEKKFDELEKQRPDFPSGRRMQPVSSSFPVNSLVWQCEFPDIASAYETLAFFNDDEEHDKLFRLQSPLMKEVKIEFYNILEF